jgi:integrase
MIERAAAGAGLELKAHPHMLRHACGYALANKGHDTRAIQGRLGHRSLTLTAVCAINFARLAFRRAAITSDNAISKKSIVKNADSLRLLSGCPRVIFDFKP